MIGSSYKLDDMALLVVDKIRDIYIISLQKYRSGFYIQFPFVPIHQSVLSETLRSAEPAGTFTPSSIEYSLRTWREHGSGYFVMSPEEIWGLAIFALKNSGKELKDFVQDGYILFPPVFPGNPETLNGSESVVHYCSEPIGKMFDIRNN